MDTAYRHMQTFEGKWCRGKLRDELDKYSSWFGNLPVVEWHIDTQY